MPNTGGLGTPGAVGSTPPPLGNLTESIANALYGGGGPGNALSGYLAGGAASQFSQQSLGALLAGQQLGVSPAAAGVQAAELGSNTSYSLANALLGYESLGTQSQGLAQQAGTAAQQQGVEQAQYQVQQGQYPEQAAAAALANQNAVTGMKDQAAISGTINGPGYARAQATQAQEYGWQQADIFRQQQLSQLAQQSEQIGFGGQEAQFANQQQQLKQAAQAQGLSAEQAYSQLQFGLNQLGIQSSPEQYLAAISQAEGGAAGTMAGALSQAALVGGTGTGYASALLGG